MAKSVAQVVVSISEGQDANEGQNRPAGIIQVSQTVNTPVRADNDSGRTIAADMAYSTECPRGTSLDATSYLESLPSINSANQDIEKGQVSIIDSTANPNLVDWNGSDDQHNPYNWTAKRKWATVGLITTQTFISPLASSMFAPGVPQVLHDFHSQSDILASLVVSVYVLGYAFGPLVIAPLSELYGRSPVYHTTNLLFIIFTIACAVASNFNMLIGFRFLEGVAALAVLTLGGGTVADMFVQEERGAALAVWQLGALIGPIIGPTAGGFLSQAEGWRWIFWVLSIAIGVVSISYIFFLRETYSVTLLERKAESLRKQTGNEALRSKMDRGLPPKALFRLSIVRPLKLLLCSPIVFSLCLLSSIVYGYYYILFTTITEVFEQKYGFSQGTAGLTYLGIGIGMLIGLIIVGKSSDLLLKRKAAISGENKPEYRLLMMIPGSFFMPIGLFIYGWTADKHIHWCVPILGTSLMGIEIIAVFLCVNAYLVDAFTLYSASAMAATVVLRSIIAGLLPLAGQPMFQALGLGWGNSVLGFIALALSPIPVLLCKYGERLRTHPKYQLNL